MVYKLSKTIKNDKIQSSYWRITDTDLIIYDKDYKVVFTDSLEVLTYEFRKTLHTLKFTEFLEIDENEFIINLIQ